MTELLQQLVEFIKDASPYVWNLLIKQEYINAYANLIWTGILLLVCIIGIIIGTKMWKLGNKENDDDWYSASFAFFIFSIISGVVGLAILTPAIKILLNPEYYAIIHIIEKLTGGN
jgi:hypothetical protein